MSVHAHVPCAVQQQQRVCGVIHADACVGQRVHSARYSTSPLMNLKVTGTRMGGECRAAGREQRVWRAQQGCSVTLQLASVRRVMRSAVTVQCTRQLPSARRVTLLSSKSSSGVDCASYSRAANAAPRLMVDRKRNGKTVHIMC